MWKNVLCISIDTVFFFVFFDSDEKFNGQDLLIDIAILNRFTNRIFFFLYVDLIIWWYNDDDLSYE